MKSFLTLSVLFSVISVAFGKALNITFSEGKIENESASLDEMNYTLYVIDPRIYAGDGTDCYATKGQGIAPKINGNKCVVGTDEIGPFTYGDYLCYLSELRAGPEDYIKTLDDFSGNKFDFHIDMNGYLRCKIDGKWRKRYRKFNFKAGMANTTSDKLIEHLERWFKEHNNKPIYKGKTYYSVGRLDIYLSISRCTDVFTHKKYKVKYNCDTYK